MNYTQFIIELVSIILEDNKDMSANQIALNQKECIGAHEQGISPSNLYFNIWQRDAGNYWGM